MSDTDGIDLRLDPGRSLSTLPLLPAMAARVESVHGALATMSMRVDALVELMRDLRGELAGLGDEMSELRATVAVGTADIQPVLDELTALKRRIGIRTRMPAIAQDQLDAIADAVADRIGTPSIELAHSQLEAIAAAVVDLLEASLDFVGEDAPPVQAPRPAEEPAAPG